MKKRAIIISSIVLIIVLVVCIILTFTKDKSYNVTMKVESEGGLVAAEGGKTSVEKGEDLKIYITPDEGYEIDKIIVDDEVIDLTTLVYERDNTNASNSEGVAVYTLKNVDKDHKIEVYYKEKEDSTSFYITMGVKTEGGSITSEQGLVGGMTSVEKGKNLKVYLAPNEGYEIDKVLVDNEALDLNILDYEKDNPNAASSEGVAVYTFKNVNKDYTIEVYYKKKTNTDKTSFNITMKVGNEGGSITSEQGLVAGKTTVEKGKNLKVYLAPNEGYEIDRVLVDNKAIELSALVYEKNNPNAASSDGVAVYTFKNVNKDYTIEVYFKAKATSDRTTFNITMEVKNEGGSITSEQGLVAGMTSVEKGHNLKVYLCPNEGYKIDKVLVNSKAIDLSTLVYDKNNPNAASSDGVAVYTFKNVSKDYTIEVYFKKK